jgi:hypothetical protein
MEFREDKRKYGWDGLENKCKGKDGKIDDDENDPTIVISHN